MGMFDGCGPSIRSAWPDVLKLTSSSPVACRSKKPAPDIPYLKNGPEPWLTYSYNCHVVRGKLTCWASETWLSRAFIVQQESIIKSLAGPTNARLILWYNTLHFCSSGSNNNVVKMHCWLPTVCGTSKIVIRHAGECHRQKSQGVYEPPAHCKAKFSETR